MSVDARFRPTTAVVDLEAIAANLKTLRPAGAEVMAMVKADAYGHGLVRVARAAQRAGATWLGVALVEEGIRLRDAGLSIPILVTTEFPPGSELDALHAGLTPTAHTREFLCRLSRAQSARSVRPAVHIKVDTGMHRIGLPPDDVLAFVQEIQCLGLGVDGLWTHFAMADRIDDSFTLRQLSTCSRLPPSYVGRGSSLACSMPPTRRPRWCGPRPDST